MRKKLMIVERVSSGTCWLRIFIMDGQNRPTIASNTQKASSCSLPSNEMPARARRRRARPSTRGPGRSAAGAGSAACAGLPRIGAARAAHATKEGAAPLQRGLRVCCLSQRRPAQPLGMRYTGVGTPAQEGSRSREHAAA